MEKILTVVVPTYNMEKYLRICLDSLIIKPQLMSLLEVIIINDGSKDNSSAIGHEYYSKYPSIFKIIDKENGNYGSCVNRGLYESKGKYIKILDADDYFDKLEFEKSIYLLLNNDADLVLTNFSIVDSNYNIIKHVNTNINEGLYSFEEAFKNKKIFNITMHGYIYKTNLLKKNNYHQTEGISYTDQEWIFEPLVYINSVLILNCNIYQYLLGRENQTMNSVNLIKNLSHTILGTEKMIRFINTISDIDNFKRKILLKRVYLRIIYIYRTFLILQRPFCKEKFILFDFFIKNKLPCIYKKLYFLYYSKKKPIPYFIIWKIFKKRIIK